MSDAVGPGLNASSLGLLLENEVKLGKLSREPERERDRERACGTGRRRGDGAGTTGADVARVSHVMNGGSTMGM